MGRPFLVYLDRLDPNYTELAKKMKLSLTTLFIALAAAGGAAAVDQGTHLRHGSENMQLVNEKLVAENRMLKEQIASMIASSETTTEHKTRQLSGAERAPAYVMW